MNNYIHKLTFKLFTGLLIGLFSGSAAYANPNGAEVIKGQVSIAQPDPTTLNITNSNGAIINWQDFSIQANEVTRFIQDSANSAVLNRVVGQDPSSLLGQLLSNGRVFLINPNGIVFGPDAIIDTAGLIASTLNMTNEDFINENLKFEGTNAADISNKGYIKAGANGDIFLIAPNIENSGVIETDGGKIVLAAGESITIASLDSDHIVFDVQAPENEVVNLGEMITNGGAAGMFAGTIKHSGSINANSLSFDKNGNVQLFAQADIEIATDAVITANGESGGEVKIESETGTVWNSGTIEAIGDEGKGGHVEVLGERVALLDEASIDASGETGGGEVLVGGDYQGKTYEVKNAKQTYIGEDTVIKADAITNGDGGKVIVWADETTQAYGRITARGGSESGDGGFIETSGNIYLDVSGSSVDASAVNGERGMWLLDPNNIEIVAGGGNVNINAATPFVSTNDTAQLGVTLITGALNLGTDVTVTTSTGGTNGQAGDITVSTAITKTAGTNATLTLNADNDININASITSTTGQLNLVLDAAQTTGSGVINLGNVTLNANGGTITATAETVNVANGANINSNFNIQTLNLSSSGILDIIGGTTTVSGTTTIGSGTTLKISSGTFNPSGLVNNAGLLDLQTGTLSLGGGGSHTGDFNIAVGSVLQLDGAAHSFNSGSNITGAGDVAFTGNNTYTFNIGSTYAISGDTGINGSTSNLNFLINAVTNSLTHTDGALTGTGSLTTTGWAPTTATVNINSLVLSVGYFGSLSSTVSGTGTITNQGALTLNGGTINPNFVNQGALSVTGGSSLAGTATQSFGITFLNGGTLTTAALNINGGVLHGDGTIAGTVNNNGGIVTPGNILGTMNITGNYMQAAGGTLQVDLDGITTAGTDYDLLNVTGNVTLAGLLDIQLLSTFAGTVGDQFDIIDSAGITGDFTTVTSSVQTFTNLVNTPLPGDYQLEIISADSSINTIATNNVIVTSDFQDILTADEFIFFQETGTTSSSTGTNGDDKKEKQNLACQ
jgi:filamentous hemagglutinin family protein